MKKLTASIFATLLTVVTVGAANANIASQGYVDEKVGTVTTSVEDLTGRVEANETSIADLDATKAETTAVEALDAAAEKIANRVTTVSAESDDQTYPTAKAVWDIVDEKTTGIASDTDVAALKTKVGDAALQTTAQDLSGAVNELNEMKTTKQDKLIGTIGSATQPVYLDNGVIKAGDQLGTLATKNTITTAEITDGTITSADISATAAIAKTQLASDVQSSLEKADTSLQAVPVATDVALGGVKSGGNITVAGDGSVTVNQAANATKATQDGAGNVIVDTYATKDDIADMATTGNIGDLGSLTTTTKDSLVGAINELDADKQDKNVGAENSGNILTVGVDGNITTSATIENTKVSGLGALATKNTVSSAEIDNDAVTTDKIASENVTKGKLEKAVQDSLEKADAAIPAPSAEQISNGGKYVLTWDGTTGYAWENIERGANEQAGGSVM